MPTLPDAQGSNVKGRLRSRTIRGALMAAVPLVVFVLRQFGLEVTPSDLTPLVDLVIHLIGMLGIAEVWQGRENTDGKRLSGWL